MKWIIGGPDLPTELLQDLEDGRLVLFCGAGISYPAGLPGFRGLVEDVYRRTNQRMVELEQAEFDRLNFDRVLGLLENRIGSTIVRRAVVKALSLDASADLATHRSLIALATNGDGACRLVTTNFDRGFEYVAGTTTLIDSAPRLPVPKVGGWNSIVHLHGRIYDADPEGRSLVMTSADFGSAYLTERWASRFLSDLFRRFAVLFVGYSVEDPVVRYMMDAFAADRALGEGVGKAFVLAGCAEGNDDKETCAWQAKGVIPLLYNSSNNHAALHQTLSHWAQCHSRGLLGKESIIQAHANKIPTKPFDQDPVVSQVVWALCEQSGHVARVFAQLDPVPPVEWLEVLQKESLLDLPCASSAAVEVSRWKVPLVDSGRRTTFAPQLNAISSALGDWVTRHLDRPAVLDWVLGLGSVLHPDFRWHIRRRLADKPGLPAALHQLWKVLGSEAELVRSNVHRFTFDLLGPLESGEWDLQLKHGVIDALSPVLEFRPPNVKLMFPNHPLDVGAISSFAEVEVVLRCKDHARLLVDAISQSPCKHQILAELADDVTSLLKRVMALYELMQKASPMRDWSYVDQPSISPHEENSAFHEWTVLLELCRESWTALLHTDLAHALQMVWRWRSLRYPVFRRLCFFAMSESELVAPSDCLAYLLEDDGWWLWSIHVNREKFRLLRSIWQKLCEKESADLVNRILTGPPRSMFRDDLSDEDFERIVNHEVWLHLLKLQQTGRPLPEIGNQRLTELSSRYPEWQVDDDERTKSAIWKGGGIGKPPVEDQDEFVKLSDHDVIERLGAVKLENGDLERWGHLLSVNLTRALGLLAEMAKAGSWNGQIWRPALKSVSIPKQCLQQSLILAPLLVNAPDSLFEEITAPVAWMLKQMAEGDEGDEFELFWQVWDRVQPFAFRDAPEEVSDVLTAALNTPAGHLAQAMLDQTARSRPILASDLSKGLWERLTLLIKGVGYPYKLARVHFASRLTWLHDLNPKWVEQHFLPFFDWGCSPEAAAVWHGYLWQARITPDLWPQIKNQFLAALKKENQLGRSYVQICHLLAAIIVTQPDWLARDEMQSILHDLGPEGRAHVSQAIFWRLARAGSQSERLWKELVGPWLSEFWPKDLDLRESKSSLNLAMAVTYAGSSFKSGVDALDPLLVSVEYPSVLWERLLKGGFAEREPQATLRLCGSIVDTSCQWPDPNLRIILDQIQASDNKAGEQPVFRKLNEYLSDRAHR